MRISFLTTHLNTFGSIRELIENANRLVDYGHDVNIYFDSKEYPFQNWLPIKAKLNHLSKLKETDVLILMDSPFDYHMEIFNKCKASFKTFVMMGFDPESFSLRLGNKKLDNMPGENTEKNLIYILNNYEVLADAQWQLDFFKERGIKTGVPIGGINLDMFKDYKGIRSIDIGYSGDRRPRKGLGTILKALEKFPMLRKDFYAKRGDQKFLINFLNDARIFVDNHLRAGWCNPVLEAMACGCVVVCNDIPASRDFAINGETAIALKDNSIENFVKSIDKLNNDLQFYMDLKRASQEKVKEFSYDVVAKRLEKYLISKL